jgi:hypothetical protein
MRKGDRPFPPHEIEYDLAALATQAAAGAAPEDI